LTSEYTGATGLAGRYATALFELAEADGQLDQVSNDLNSLAAMIRDSDDLHRTIRSPVLSRHEQARAMTAIMAKAGMSDLTTRFVGLVASKRRLFALPGMIGAFQHILATHRGESTAQVTSTKDLTDGQLTAIKASLKAAVGTDVTVDARIDPGLLGGLIVKVGSRMVDSSLRTKLQQLRLAMKGVG
jgi:F-type H+-transporting ATPase subunit delta